MSTQDQIRKFQKAIQPVRAIYRIVNSEKATGIEDETCAYLERRIAPGFLGLTVSVVKYYVICGLYVPVICHLHLVTKLKEKIAEYKKEKE